MLRLLKRMFSSSLTPQNNLQRLPFLQVYSRKLNSRALIGDVFKLFKQNLQFCEQADWVSYFGVTCRSIGRIIKRDRSTAIFAIRFLHSHYRHVDGLQQKHFADIRDVVLLLQALQDKENWLGAKQQTILQQYLEATRKKCEKKIIKSEDFVKININYFLMTLKLCRINKFHELRIYFLEFLRDYFVRVVSKCYFLNDHQIKDTLREFQRVGLDKEIIQTIIAGLQPQIQQFTKDKIKESINLVNKLSAYVDSLITLQPPLNVMQLIESLQKQLILKIPHSSANDVTYYFSYCLQRHSELPRRLFSVYLKLLFGLLNKDGSTCLNPSFYVYIVRSAKRSQTKLFELLVEDWQQRFLLLLKKYYIESQLRFTFDLRKFIKNIQLNKVLSSEHIKTLSKIGEDFVRNEQEENELAILKDKLKIFIAQIYTVNYELMNTRYLALIRSISRFSCSPELLRMFQLTYEYLCKMYNLKNMLSIDPLKGKFIQPQKTNFPFVFYEYVLTILLQISKLCFSLASLKKQLVAFSKVVYQDTLLLRKRLIITIFLLRLDSLYLKEAFAVLTENISLKQFEQQVVIFEEEVQESGLGYYFINLLSTCLQSELVNENIIEINSWLVIHFLTVPNSVEKLLQMVAKINEERQFKLIQKLLILFDKYNYLSSEKLTAVDKILTSFGKNCSRALRHCLGSFIVRHRLNSNSKTTQKIKQFVTDLQPNSSAIYSSFIDSSYDKILYTILSINFQKIEPSIRQLHMFLVKLVALQLHISIHSILDCLDHISSTLSFSQLSKQTLSTISQLVAQVMAKLATQQVSSVLRYQVLAVFAKCRLFHDSLYKETVYYLVEEYRTVNPNQLFQLFEGLPMSKTKAMFLDLLPVLMANPFENYESAMRVFCLIDEPMDDLLVLLKNLIKSQRQDKKPLSREVTEYLHRFHPSLASQLYFEVSAGSKDLFKQNIFAHKRRIFNTSKQIWLQDTLSLIQSKTKKSLKTPIKKEQYDRR